jgi:PAS domain-containing protein
MTHSGHCSLYLGRRESPSGSCSQPRSISQRELSLTRALLLDNSLDFSRTAKRLPRGRWSARLHPEDRKRVFDEMFPLIERGGGTVEYRFRHRSGDYIWIQDDQGRPSEIVGSWADISDRKQAEQALGERMAVMKDLQTLVGASPAIIYTICMHLRQ